MLVLTRRTMERIFIEQDGKDPIIVTLLRVTSKEARIGIDADRSLVIRREELIDRPNSGDRNA